jgi:methylmalonyl-CoA mutase
MTDKRKPVYTAADLEGISHLNTLPGEAPFVRGPYASMYTEKPWTVRQYAGFAGAAASNAFFHELLNGGAQGLSVAFDLPTHRGYDSDHPAAGADVGLAGVAIDSVDDMVRLFDGIALDRVSVSMTMSGAVLPVLGCFILAAREQGVSACALTGTIQNDILKEFMVRNTYIYAPRPSLRIAADVVAYVARHMPRFNAMSISGYHFQEAGADAALELALTLSNAQHYLRELIDRGMDIDDFCRNLSFFFGVGTEFFQETAKLRAARLLWCEIVQANGGMQVRSQAMRMHCQTSGWSLCAEDPLNNVVRTTIQAMAAVCAGTQSLHTNAFDEALALPSSEAARLAKNTQLILQHETDLCEIVDPWAGSFMMERLTADMAQAARLLMEEIDQAGGVVAALESGWLTRRIHIAASRKQAQIDAGKHIVVGQNAYGEETVTPAPKARKVDGPAIRREQSERLAALRAGRDARAVDTALAALAHAAQTTDENLLELTIAALDARATVGECTQALERVWPRHRVGAEYSAGVYAHERQGDSTWERVRARVARVRVDRPHADESRAGGSTESPLRDELLPDDRFPDGRLQDSQSQYGQSQERRPPSLLIVKLGQDGHDRGAKAVAGALADAGFRVHLGGLFASPREAAELARKLAVDVVGVSTLTGAHLALIPMLLQCLRDVGLAGVPLIAGGVIPEVDRRRLTDAGVSAIFGPGTPMDRIALELAELIDAVRSRPVAAVFAH